MHTFFGVDCRREQGGGCWLPSETYHREKQRRYPPVSALSEQSLCVEESKPPTGPRGDKLASAVKMEQLRRESRE